MRAPLLLFTLFSALTIVVKSSAPDCGIRNQFRGYCFSFDYCAEGSCGSENCGHFPRHSELLTIRNTRIIPQCAVTNSVTLRCINGINKNIQVLSSGAFANLPKLDSILLPFNLIRELHHGIFYKVNVPLVDLSSNKIIYISEGAFNGITGLKYLNLSKNELATFPVENLPRSIVKINLSHNFLERIVLNGANRPDLTSIDMSYNNLKHVALSFDNILEYLDLTRNDLKDIDFYDVNDCETLKITSNSFSSVPQFLEYSRIRRVALHPNPWKCDELTKLWSHLQNNNVEEIPHEDSESTPLCSNNSKLRVQKSMDLECETDSHCRKTMVCRAHKCWDPCNDVCDATNICSVKNHEVECLCPGLHKKNPYEVFSPCYDVECFLNTDCAHGFFCTGNKTCTNIPTFMHEYLTNKGVESEDYPLISYRETGVNGQTVEIPWWFSEIPKLSPVNTIYHN